MKVLVNRGWPALSLLTASTTTTAPLPLSQMFVTLACVVTDPLARNTFLSKGSFGWSGAYNAHLWVDPKEKIVAILMTQTDREFREQQEVRGDFRSLLKRCGFKRAGVHILRHTFGAHLAQKGVDMAVIPDLLGHHSVTLTEKYYAHLAPSSLTSAVQRDDVAYFICCFSCKSMF